MAAATASASSDSPKAGNEEDFISQLTYYYKEAMIPIRKSLDDFVAQTSVQTDTSTTAEKLHPDDAEFHTMYWGKASNQQKNLMKSMEKWLIWCTELGCQSDTHLLRPDESSTDIRQGKSLAQEKMKQAHQKSTELSEKICQLIKEWINAPRSGALEKEILELDAQCWEWEQQALRTYYVHTQGMLHSFALRPFSVPHSWDELPMTCATVTLAILGTAIGFLYPNFCII